MGDEVRGDTEFGVVNNWLIYGTYSPPKIAIFSMIDKIPYIYGILPHTKKMVIFSCFVPKFTVNLLSNQMGMF